MKESNPYRHFQTDEDYTKWDNFLKQIDSIELTKRDQTRARRMIEYLRKLLGEDFLSAAQQSGHPILYQYLKNSAPPGRLLLIHLTELLETFESSPNFHALVERIKDASEFSEGQTVLETAAKFHRVEFSVDFDITVEVVNYNGEKRTKKPDLLLTNIETGEKIYVEVTRSRTSQMQLANSRTYDIIWHVIHNAVRFDPQTIDITKPEHILPYAQIHRNLTEDELINAVEQIERLIKKVRESGEFQELNIEDMIDIAISPYQDHSCAKQWAKQRGLTDFVEGPLIETDEISRAINKIFRKLEQLPRDKLGIIEIWNNENLMFFTCDIPAIIAQVAAKISKYQHLFGVALNLNYGSGKENDYVIELNQHSLVSNIREDSITELSLFVRNASFNLPLTHSTKTKLEQAYKLQNLQ
jgi:hypothetical protein